mmetsp:Transcript_31441/g.75852  ORF Transcript_31441/g.75852 Transcript_31441/m.75852 type:complete len:2512 (-) Transcript_31441:67-7602(-)
MGKKSKKNKNKASNHQARNRRALVERNRQEERGKEEQATKEQQQQQEAVQDDGTPQPYGGKPRQFFLGDHVRHFDPTEDDIMIRGTIVAGNGQVKPSPKQLLFKPIGAGQEEGYWLVWKRDVYTDLHFTQLKYQVRDRVLCCIDDKDEEWIEHVVVREWPRPPPSIDHCSVLKSAYPLYICRAIETGIEKTIFEDLTETEIKDIPSRTRFKVGDIVVINADKAKGIKEGAIKHLGTGGWREGKIVKTIPKVAKQLGPASSRGRNSYYTVYMGSYECSFRDDKGKVHRCYIPEDTDEHIARDDPRTRLMDAIEDDCCMEHISFLVKEFGIDVSSIEEIVFLKAIDHSSYNALWWMEANLGLSVRQRLESGGEALVERFASSPNILRFMQTAVEENDEERDSGVEDIRAVLQGSPGRRDDPNSNVFLTTLLRTNMRALDYALSPLALGYLYRLTDGTKRGLRVKGSPSSRPIVSYIADRLFAFFKLIGIEHSLDGSETPAAFRGPNAKSQVVRYLRSCWDYWKIDIGSFTFCGYDFREFSTSRGLAKTAQLAFDRELDILRLWIEAQPLLLSNDRLYSKDLHIDYNEYVQAELEGWEDEDIAGNLSLVECVVHGVKLDDFYSQNWPEEIYTYHSELDSFASNESFHPNAWIKRMEDFTFNEDRNYQIYEPGTVFGRKKSIMTDDDNCDDQIRLLEYLVKQKGLNPPSYAMAVRFRQCSVVRWLLANGFLDVTDSSKLEPDLMMYSEEMSAEFKIELNPQLNDKKFLLCLATVQYDDIQTLAYMVDNFGHDIIGYEGSGFNLVHAAAHFGRIEIMHYLSTLAPFADLVMEAVGSGKYQGWFASHIAVSSAHITIADLLFSRNCPVVDLNGRSVSLIASKSDHDFVNSWTPAILKSMQLEKDVNMLLELLAAFPLAALKEHVVQSQCMEPQSWINVGCTTLDEKGRLPYSFRSMIMRCAQPGAINLCLWMAARALSNKENYAFFNEETNSDSVATISCVDFEGVSDDDDLAQWLQSSWAKGIEVRDYIASVNPFVELFDESSQRRLTAMVKRIGTIKGLCSKCLDEVERLLFSPGSERALRELIQLPGVLNAKLIEEGIEPHDDKHQYLTKTGQVKLESNIRNDDKRTNLFQTIKNYSLIPSDLERLGLYVLLALDGDAGVIRLCLELQCDLTANSEIIMAYLASRLKRKDVVEVFLDDGGIATFSSSINDRCWLAIVGAAECGDLLEMHDYLSRHLKTVPGDPIKSKYEELIADDYGFEAFLKQLGTLELEPGVTNGVSNALEESISLCYSFTSGFVLRYGKLSQRATIGSNCAGSQEVREMALLGAYENRHFLFAALVTKRYKSNIDLGWVFEGILYLFDCLDIDSHCTSQERDLLHELTETFVRSYIMIEPDGSNLSNSISAWSDKVSRLGIPLPGHLIAGDRRIRNAAGKKFIQGLISKQEQVFGQFDALKNGCTMQELQQSVTTGNIDPNSCDASGLRLVHISAAYDRVDVLEWLVNDNIAALSALDAHGRSVLEVAKSSKAKRTNEWIIKRQASHVITSFMRRCTWQFQARKRLDIVLHGIRRLQAMCRGWSARQTAGRQLLLRVEISRRFQLVWGGCLHHVNVKTQGVSRWSLIRDTMVDFVKSTESWNEDDSNEGGSNDLVETIERLDIAMESAISATVENATQDDCAVHAPGDGDATEESLQRNMTTELSIATPTVDKAFCRNVQYTNHIVKWLKQSDPKYKDFFVRRITQLSRGERSRILAKRLKGSKTVTIYETYLEQKSGFRILWTEEGNDILVWYVAKHDVVSRMVKLIDDSQARSNRQLVRAETSNDASEKDDMTCSSRIVLDPMGNVPMKVFEFGGIDEIGQVAQDNWTPRLKLTDEERGVVETTGTVLLLGRSGTGKTVCILSRMDYDRQVNEHDSTFTQLFVAQSRRLCKYVSESVGQTLVGNANTDATETNMTFTTFDELLSRLENTLPRAENIRDVFRRSERMTFQRFKTEVYSGDKGIDPLLVWGCIRSFIKGSIEATTRADSHIVDRISFLSLEIFGSRRCRLSVDEQRPIVYDVYEKYQRYMLEYNLWDDCDRIMSLLQRLESSKTTAPEIYHQVRKRKIYVDEIQDYTQAECLLFFYLSGPGDLFLAGDPAQSVVEGVEFRFEDIRSVEYHIAKDKSGLLLQKPKTVNVNYRSHAGILNTAAAVLSCMFGAFPHSAKQLKEDRGVFVGPRPGVLYKVSSEMLNTVIQTKLKGTVVLVHDSSVSRWRHALGGYPLVYGIRAAKGLEFKSVIVLDFFGELAGEISKAWRSLLLGRSDETFQIEYPEIESQMKLLYTAVTRSIERLFFVETVGSVAGEAFVRWVTTKSTSKSRDYRAARYDDQQIPPLATRNKVDDVESMTMTRDEWLSSGMDNAEAAEDEEDLSVAESFLDKAIYCFREAQDHNLAHKACAHRESVRFQSRLPMLSTDSKEEGERDCDSSESQMLEVEGARIVESLLRESLLEEAKNLCLRLLPYLSNDSASHLERKILHRLPV